MDIAAVGLLVVLALLAGVAGGFVAVVAARVAFLDYIVRNVAATYMVYNTDRKPKVRNF